MQVYQLANRILMGVLMVIGVIFTILIFLNWTDDPNWMDPAEVEARDSAVKYIGWALDYTIWLVYAAVGLWGIAMIIFYGVNPQKLIKGGIVVGAFALILGIAYGMSSDIVPSGFDDLTPTVAQYSDAGLITVYLLCGLAGISIVFSFFSKALK